MRVPTPRDPLSRAGRPLRSGQLSSLTARIPGEQWERLGGVRHLTPLPGESTGLPSPSRGGASCHGNALGSSARADKGQASLWPWPPGSHSPGSALPRPRLSLKLH